jgi:hypothetical protein
MEIANSFVNPAAVSEFFEELVTEAVLVCAISCPTRDHFDACS